MMKFRFQSFFDVSTSAESMQILQFSVGGSNILDRCRHLFGAYKYFKLGKISVKMVPASTLPVDPLGLSYSESDPQTVDPRDQMNPGLVRITNGEDLFLGISSLNASQQENIYNAMMLDPRWSKFMLQSGFRRSAYPLYWQIGQLSQDKYPGSITNLPSNGSPTSTPFVARESELITSQATITRAIDQDVSSARGFFQVGHRGKLGFLPTDFFQYVQSSSEGDSRFTARWGANNIPEVKVITCILPKAYKTQYYYRIFVTEEVIFAGLRSAPMLTSAGQQYVGIDTFMLGYPFPVNPGTLYLSPAPSSDMIQNNGQDGE